MELIFEERARVRFDDGSIVDIHINSKDIHKYEVIERYFLARDVEDSSINNVS